MMNQTKIISWNANGLRTRIKSGHNIIPGNQGKLWKNG